MIATNVMFLRRHLLSKLTIGSAMLTRFLRPSWTATFITFWRDVLLDTCIEECQNSHSLWVQLLLFSDSPVLKVGTKGHQALNYWI